MWWVETRKVAPVSRWISVIIPHSSERRTPSMPLSKSSMSTIRASSASALAIATRLHIPAERCSGMSPARSASPTIPRCSIVTWRTRSSDQRLRWRRAKATFS